MNRPIELTGVINGTTITLDERTFLPDGYRVKLHLILEPEEGLRLALAAGKEIPPEDWAEFEEFLSENRGRPIKIPGPDAS
jgi:hypothetical protein